ncbi:MAG TPA: sulfatase [Candidatus Saccharimonadales bacterium]|nr:sulfatase [Candidatus Saccharimonadales bacterium]
MRSAVARFTRAAFIGTGLGCVVGVVNWMAGFTDSEYARAFLVALLVIWGGLGLVASLAIALAWEVLGRFVPALAESLRERTGYWSRGLVIAGRTWIVIGGLGLAALTAYVGSAPGFAGLLTTTPRDPESEAKGRPNIIIVSLDTTRADHIGAYGYGKPTSPVLDGIAAGGTLFKRAISASSWTVPAHAAFFTGLAPSHLSAALGPEGDRHWSRVPRSATMLAEILHAVGYHTAGFIAGPPLAHYFGFSQGFDEYADRRPISFQWKSNQIFGARLVRRLLNIPPWRFLSFVDPPFLRLVDYLYGEIYEPPSELEDQILKGSPRWISTSEEVNHRVFRWLDRRPPRPYFLFVHYFDPHDPYEPEPRYAPKGWDPREGFVSENGLFESVLKDGKPLDPGLRDRLIGAYDGEIMGMDHQLGLLFDRLRAEHDLDNAIIAIVSDHGELFGEHGLVFHGHHLFDPLTHVVFLLAGKGVPAGRTIDMPVSGIDLTPTLLDLAGVSFAGSFEGRSLRPLLDGDRGVEPRPLFSEVFGGRAGFPEWKAFSSGRVSVELDGMKLVDDLDNGFELYDLRSDPGENDNLEKSRPDAVAKLDALIKDYLARSRAVQKDETEKGTESEDVLEVLRGLGYVQ